MIYQYSIFKEVFKKNMLWILLYLIVFSLSFYYVIFVSRDFDYINKMFLVLISYPNIRETAFIFPLLIMFQNVFTIYLIQVFLNYEKDNSKEYIYLRRKEIDIVKSKLSFITILILILKSIHLIIGIIFLKLPVLYIIKSILYIYLMILVVFFINKKLKNNERVIFLIELIIVLILYYNM